MRLARLPHHKPVDIGVVVKSDTQRLVEVHISIGKRRRLLNLVELIFQVIEVREVGGTVLVALCHRGIEAITSNADAFAEYRGLECQGRQVTLQLVDECLAQHLHIVDSRCLTVVGGHRAHSAQVTIERAQL